MKGMSFANVMPRCPLVLALTILIAGSSCTDDTPPAQSGPSADTPDALAADLYSGQVGSSPDENRSLMSEHLADPDAMIANLNAAARFLRERDDVTGRVGTMGWCFGGGVALTYALGGEDHEATAIFYGSLVTDPEILGSIDHEVYGSFAENDGGIPPEQVNEFVAALRAAGIDNDVHIDDEVNHGFWLRIDGNPELRSEPGLDAWRRLKGYLRRTLSD
ncbi:MAG TPA: hypothetical protein EYQ64_12625 [Gemmatimonadetes bacterium]|nr:hypothetical protein [Gemmatimonadota bacterium]